MICQKRLWIMKKLLLEYIINYNVLNRHNTNDFRTKLGDFPVGCLNNQHNKVKQINPTICILYHNYGDSNTFYFHKIFQQKIPHRFQVTEYQYYKDIDSLVFPSYRRMKNYQDYNHMYHMINLCPMQLQLNILYPIKIYPKKQHYVGIRTY